MHTHPQPRNPRLLLVTSAQHGEEIDRQLTQFAPGLAQRGFEVTIYRVGGHGPGAGVLSRLGRGVTMFSSGLGLVAEMLVDRPDIVHFSTPEACLTGLAAAALTQVPVRILSRRDTQNDRLKRRSDRWMHSNISAILVNSKQFAYDLIRHGGVRPERTALIRDGIDTARFRITEHRDLIRARLSLDSGTMVFSCLADLAPNNGHADLLTALAMIADRLPRSWKLLAIGRDAGALAALQDQAAKHGLSNHIRWMGRRRDLPQLLAASDIGVIASHEQGTSGAVLESMAAGLPMVVTDAGGNAEAVRHGETGFITPARDPQALAQSLIQLVENPLLAARLGAAGRRRAVHNFALETCLDTYEATYRALLAGNGLPARVSVDGFAGAGLMQRLAISTPPELARFAESASGKV